jgi:hypothetical protein
MFTFLRGISVLFILLLFACKKQESDKHAPALYVISPLSNMEQSYTSDPQIHLECTVSDESHIEFIQAELLDSTGTIYYQKTLAPHVLLYPFHVHCTMMQPSSPQKMRFHFSSSDAAGNKIDTLIYFIFKP